MTLRFRVNGLAFKRSESDDIKSALPKYNKMLADAIELGLIADGNYRRIIRKGGGGLWKPLSPKYVEQKRKRGLGSRKWVLSGDTLRALTQVSMVAPHPGRDVKIAFMSKTKLKVRVKWTMKYPVASGWPGRKNRNRRSYFLKNDRIRPLLEQIDEQAESDVNSRMAIVVERLLFWEMGL